MKTNEDFSKISHYIKQMANFGSKTPGDHPGSVRSLADKKLPSSQICCTSSSMKAQTNVQHRGQRKQPGTADWQRHQADFHSKWEDTCSTVASFCNWQNPGRPWSTYLHFREAWPEAVHFYDKESITGGKHIHKSSRTGVRRNASMCCSLMSENLKCLTVIEGSLFATRVEKVLGSEAC